MKKLLKSLTIKEKLGQLTQIAPHYFTEELKAKIYGKDNELKIEYDDLFLIGSILGISGPKEKIHLQKLYLEKSKNKIPLLFMADVIHGCKTIYPVPLAQACSFNLDLVEKNAQMAAKEAKAFGIDVTFSPMSDLVRDPRWGRVVESFGEDPYLNYCFSKATTQGYKKANLISCVKHFAGYGLSEAGRDYNTVDLSRINLFNYFLSGYKGALEGNAQMVMSSFNTFEYLPSTINKYLLNDIIREKWGYKDVVIIADYDALLQTKAHGVALSDEDAAIKGIMATLDIEMASTAYLRTLENDIIKDKKIIKKINESTLRVLNLKNEYNLFNNHFNGNSEDLLNLINSKEHQKLSYQLALESAVLLKNENKILPFKKTTKISLLGNYALEKDILGPWSWYGEIEKTASLNDTLKAFYVNESEDINDYNISKIEQTDVILLAIGELRNESGEARNKANIEIKESQIKLIKDLKKLNMPIVLVIYSGRPLILTNIINDVEAILYSFFLGSYGSFAIKDLLFGDSNPSGKLAMTFPRAVGQIPLYYNHLHTGRPFDPLNKYTTSYLDVSNEPLFEFGFGLSYSLFEYGEINVSNTNFTKENLPTIAIEVTNKSNVEGKEVVMLFITDKVASITRPVKELKQFIKIKLLPFETKKVEFKLKMEDISFYNSELEYVAEKGEFIIEINHQTKKIFYGG